MATETIEVTVKTMDSGQQKFEVNEEVCFSVLLQPFNAQLRNKLKCCHVISCKRGEPIMCWVDKVKMHLNNMGTAV